MRARPIIRGTSTSSGEARAAALFGEVVEANARLAASWMAAGFVHGVLNTDNLNITGESFDYGPWRFLPTSDPSFTAAYFDENGLYAFGRQPEAVSWALAQLGGALTLGVSAPRRLKRNSRGSCRPIRSGCAMRCSAGSIWSQGDVRSRPGVLCRLCSTG